MIFRREVRWGLGLAGSILGMLYPVAFLFGNMVRHRYRCRGREFTGNFDDCFNDYLPILELGWVVISFILGLIFIRLSFRIWAGAGEGDWHWLWGKKPDYESTGPFRRWGLLVGLGLSIWQLTRLPINLDWLHWTHLYWFAFILWFALSYMQNFKFKNISL
jgi:hypothetical protein